ncbi:MAG: hypothetical protein ACE5GE_16655 [Phycisphaerae bacterium]
MIVSLGAIVAAAPMTWAGDVIDIAADVQGGAIVGEFEAGAIVPIQFFVTSSSSAPLYGVDIDVVAITDDIRIASVTRAPVFSEEAGPSRSTDGARRHRSARTQSRTGFDHSLGIDGRPLHFATVEVEVLSPWFFESGLMVRGMGALLGRAPTATHVLGDEGRGGRGQGFIRIANTRSAGTEPSATMQLVWDTFVGQLAFELRPVGVRQPAIDLTARTAYEVHYWADTANVTGYALYALTDSADQSLSAASPPESGDWSEGQLFVFAEAAYATEFTEMDLSRSAGHSRYDVIGDDLWPCQVVCAAPSGHLCNVTTDGPGTMVLQLIMYQDDMDAQQTVEMQAEAVFDVYAQTR